MAAPSVSLIIVSRDRPDGLRKILTSLRFQTYANFETIVVSSALPDVAQGDFKFVNYDEPNISAARNLGLGQAAGQIVAFCDDDAIPEPQWLERLVTGFSDPTVGIAGGFVKGRNGISFQWKGLSTDLNGNDAPVHVTQDVTIHTPTAEKFTRPVGTNCAFRSDVIGAIGGFDPVFAFFLDETELCLRLSRAGHKTAVVCSAQVQHGFEASAGRTAQRVPTDLYQIGVSKGAFVAAYGDQTCLDAFRADQKSRLISHMVAGRLEPRDISPLMAGLNAGFDHGAGQKLSAPKITLAQSPFKRTFTTACVRGQCVTDPDLAVQMASDGIAVTLIQLSFTSLFHKRGFDARGFWLQTGGQYGRSERSDPLWRYYSKADRVEVETQRLSDQRVFDKVSQQD